MLKHFSTGFLALAAFLRAFFHVLILLEFLALLAATRAGLRTSLADEIAEHAAARRDARSGGAVLSTIQTRSQSSLMFLLALREHVLTVSRAGITGALTVVTSLRAVVEGVGMMIGASGFLVRRSSGAQGQSGCQAEKREEKGPHSCTSTVRASVSGRVVHSAGNGISFAKQKSGGANTCTGSTKRKNRDRILK